MTLVNTVASEVTERISEADVDASIERVRRHAESIWDEWAWQVENRTWEIKGYSSWDEMRQVEYTNLHGVTAPRAERPELIARFRQAGLTQRETADTLGVSRRTIQAQDEPTYEKRKIALSGTLGVTERTVQRNDPTEGSRGPIKNTTNVGFQKPDADDVIEAELVDDDPMPPQKPLRADMDSSTVALINDLRGPWSRGITYEARRMSPQARSFLIDALQTTLDQIREIHHEHGSEV